MSDVEPSADTDRAPVLAHADPAVAIPDERIPYSLALGHVEARVLYPTATAPEGVEATVEVRVRETSHVLAPDLARVLADRLSSAAAAADAHNAGSSRR